MVSESVVHAYAGGAGGLVSMAATYPLMAISTRAAVDRSARPGESMLHAARKVLAEEGLRGLYDGLGSKLLQSILTAAILFASKERIYVLTKSLLEASTRMAAVA